MHSAFDAFAPEYDVRFTGTALGRLLRFRVWRTVAACCQPGERVLELTCGTGEDAVWLAQKGLWVTATDGSPQMLETAGRKAQAAGMGERVSFSLLDIGSKEDGNWRLTPQPPDARFDGVLSNFGGLNVIGDWRPLAGRLAELVRPGGWVVLVPMGPFCPWEIAWYALHADLHTAFRRLRGPASARIGPLSVPIYYPSASRLCDDFAPWFQLEGVRSLGLWLPPSYLGHLVERFPRLFAWLDRVETGLAGLTSGWGDHYIVVLRRM